MAQMYPERLPSQIDSDAERKVFDLLQSNLSDEYAVLWHILLKIKRPVNQGGVEDREIDFLVIHPQYGILVLEVKGGGVGFISKRHQWFTLNRKSQYREIKDPFEQAQGCMYELLRQLKSDGLSRFTIGCATVFPDISEQDAVQLADDSQKPIELILDHSKIEGTLLATSIENAFRYHKRRSDEPLGQDAFDKIIHKYKRTWFVPSLILSDLSIEKKHLEELTEQQFMLLDFLSNHNRAAIYGFAGTTTSLVKWYTVQL